MGREQELANLTNRFAQEHIVVLSGLGGIGKTELALKFGRECWLGRAYFVYWHGDWFNTAVYGVADGIDDVTRQNRQEQDVYSDVMARLRQCSVGDLMILDNVDMGSLETLKKQLSTLPLRFLITTRQDDAEAIIVHAMENVDLYNIFRNHGVMLAEREMNKLIEAVDGHTLAVDLMARLLRRERRGDKVEELLAALKKMDLVTPGFAEIQTVYPGGDEQQRINEHLKVVFRVSNLSCAAQMLLRFATLLGKSGLDSEVFAKAAQEGMPGEMERQKYRQAKDVLMDLADTGWLQWERDDITIHTVIRIVAIEVLKPHDLNCDVFLRGVRSQYDRNDYNHKKYTQMGDVFAESSKVLEDKGGVWANEAGFFWLVLRETQKALEYSLWAVEKMERYHPGTTKLAASYNNVGCTYYEQGTYEKALEYGLKALAINEKVLQENHPDLVQAYNNAGVTYGDMGDYEKALGYLLKALSIREKTLPSNHSDLATSYDNVGGTYSNLGDYEKAIEYLWKALTIRQKILPIEHPDIARSYNNVGYTYGELGEYEKAVEYLSKAMLIRQKVLPADHPDLAITYNNLGSTYCIQGEYKNALEYLMKALKIQEQVLPANHPHLAQSCNNLAWTYYEKGDLPEAAQYMCRAAEIISCSSLPENHFDRVKFNKWADQLEEMVRKKQGEK